MAKPSRDNIQNGNQGWDATVNNNFIRLYDRPMPVFLHTGDQTDVATSFPPASYEECLVIVDHTVVGLTPYMVDKNHPSGSATWVPLGMRHAGKRPPTFHTGSVTLGYDELLVIGNPGAIATYTFQPVADMAGLTVTIKNVSAFVITADADGAETIDGNLTYPIPAGASVDFYCDGSVWHIV
jgi:hypothetical protein